MKLRVRNTLHGLIPLYPADLDEKKKLKLNTDYEGEFKIPRNPKFHRKFFALLNLGYDNTQLVMPFDVYRKHVTKEAGYYKTYQTAKGSIDEVDSISFASMTEETFAELYDRVIDVIIADLGVSKEDIINEIAENF